MSIEGRIHGYLPQADMASIDFFRTLDVSDPASFESGRNAQESLVSLGRSYLVTGTFTDDFECVEYGDHAATIRLEAPDAPDFAVDIALTASQLLSVECGPAGPLTVCVSASGNSGLSFVERDGTLGVTNRSGDFRCFLSRLGSDDRFVYGVLCRPGLFVEFRWDHPRG